MEPLSSENEVAIKNKVAKGRKRNGSTNLTGKAARGASWLAIFNSLGQLISWGNTILIARLLAPSDYGLKTMATMLTGYVLMFNELGLGRAIVQKTNSTKNELASVFWFTVMSSSAMMIIAMSLSIPTAILFKNKELIPITIISAIGFLLQGLQIVPRNILHKELKFKQLGVIHLISTIVTSTSMLIFALMNMGVWTLVLGNIVMAVSSLFCVFFMQKWRPHLYFNLKEVKEYIKYGVTVAIGSTFHYVLEVSDRFVAAKVWNAVKLGYYTFALELARLPLFKIVSIINQVSFPVFARLQNDKEGTKNFYLKVTKITAILVFPLFSGGFLIGDELVIAILDEKWIPIVFFFRYLCLAQLLVAVNAINGFVHNAQGRPMWNTVFVALEAFLMPLSFMICIKYGEKAFLLPWFTSYLLMNSLFLFKTLKKLEISFFKYVTNLSIPGIAVLVMSLAVLLFKRYPFMEIESNVWVKMIIEIGAGGIAYVGYLYAVDRGFLIKMKHLFIK